MISSFFIDLRAWIFKLCMNFGKSNLLKQSKFTLLPYLTMALSKGNISIAVQHKLCFLLV